MGMDADATLPVEARMFAGTITQNLARAGVVIEIDGLGNHYRTHPGFAGVPASRFACLNPMPATVHGKRR